MELRNIFKILGGFIGSAERRNKFGEHPKLFKSDNVTFTLDENPHFYYKYPKKPFDII